MQSYWRISQQIPETAFCIGVFSEIDLAEDVPILSLDVRHIMEVLDEAKTRLNLVFLDACRNNTYSRSCDLLL